MSVIELQLTRSGKEYLIGAKCTYADLMFIPWNRDIDGAPSVDFVRKTWPKKYPVSYAWHQRLMARDGVVEAKKVTEQFMGAAH